MIFVLIFYCLNAYLLISGINPSTRIQQTQPLSAPLTSFSLYEDKFYVGGANNIYVLDKDLKQIQVANTCESPKDTCSTNVNKILLAHRSETFDILVSCGTGNLGVCEARNLSNIKSILWSSSSNHAHKNYLTGSTIENRPAVGLITENGTFFIALTFGDGIYFYEKILQNHRKTTTYKYAISARKLNNFEPYTDNTDEFKEKVLRIQIVSSPIEDYLIYYKVCFQHNGMVYFFTNQKSEVGSPTYVTKLVRICEEDTGFYSYTDIFINCNHQNEKFNLVQDAVLIESKQYSGKIVAVFTQGDNPEKPSGDSVVCIAEIQTVEDTLMSAKRSYFSSCNGTRNESTRYLPDHKKNEVSRVCLEVMENDELACGKEQVYSNVIGSESVNMEAKFFTSKVSGTITTLVGASYENKTTLIFGTSAGIMIQTVLLSNNLIKENYKMKVDPGDAIKKIYTIGEETIYVMNNKRVIKYATSNCSEFKSCDDVVRRKHPLCGWCVYEERSTRRYACSNESHHWISSFRNCLTMSVEPLAIPLSNTSKSSNTRVIIRMNEIPVKYLGDEYLCRLSFHPHRYITNAAELDNTTFSCLLQNVSVLGAAKIELLVKTKAGIEVTMSSASILFYDCREYKMCMECIDTKLVKCNWCGHDANCQASNSGCLGPIFDSEKCPQLAHNRGKFISHGTNAMTSFRIANAVNFTWMIYRCSLQASESVTATLNGDILYCPSQVMRMGHKKKTELKISVTYGPTIDKQAEIDDPFKNSVTIYRCELLALDCSHCKALNKSRYSCNWGTNNECVHADENAISHCPPTNITKITPNNGSIYGGTYVTIYGKNLGMTFSAVENITVANVTCDFIKYQSIAVNPDFEYMVPSRLICKTRPSPTVKTGTVTVVVRRRFLNSDIEFTYKSPEVYDIYPDFGPKAGGTKVTVYGKNLGIGNRKISLFFGNHRCELKTDITEGSADNQNDTFECVIRCITSDPCSSNVTELQFTMDGRKIVTNTKNWYKFVNDPVIVRILPLTAFVSGGTILNLEGQSLRNAHSSSLKLYFKGETSVAYCEILSETNVVCGAPEAPKSLKEQLESRAARRGKRRCDESINVSMTINLDAVNHTFKISYFNDPVFDILPEDKNVLTFDPSEPWIFISGKCFGTIHQDFDIAIKVDDKSCTIINITQTNIECIVPTVNTRLISGSTHLEINVTIGNIHVTVGYFSYKTDENLHKDDHAIQIVYISIAAFFVWIFISGIFCFCRRYRKLKNRVTYLEGKQTCVKRRQIGQCSRTFNQSGIYCEISMEEVVDIYDAINFGGNEDQGDDYLVLHPVKDANEANTLLKVKTTETGNAVSNSKDSVDEDDQAYIHAIYNVDEDASKHIKNTEK